MEIPSSIFSLGLAAHNCLTLELLLPDNYQKTKENPIEEFTWALIATIPSARERDEALAYQAILRGLNPGTMNPNPAQSDILHALIERSPLTALWSLDWHTPAALDRIGKEHLPGWKNIDGSLTKIWDKPESWLQAVVSLANIPCISQWIRQRWLAMPETRRSCRNIGLVLELLRRHGTQREYILEFYEAYDYFIGKNTRQKWQEVKHWPILTEINKLLGVAGDTEAAIAMNRRGNEYFFKFLPLIKIMIGENGIPSDYNLSREFVFSLRSLLNYVSYKSKQQIEFHEAAFEYQSHE